MLFSLGLLLITGAVTERIPVHVFEPLGGSLFLSEDEAVVARRRITEEDWARRIGDQLVRRAERLATTRLRVPAAPGQWMHWYVCKVDGARLQARKPTEHVCPECDRVYRGWPYDQVYNTMRHNFWMEAVETLGWAYTLTGESRYAQRVREILLEYGAFYKDLPIHGVEGKQIITGGRLYAQTLEEAIALCHIVKGYDRVYRDPCFRKPDHEEIERELIRPMIQTIRKYNPGKSNWQAWQNAAVGSAALLIGDEDLANWAINGKTGFIFQMNECVLENGMWFEETASYHFYALRAHVHLMEAAARAGIAIYRHPKTLLLFEAPLRQVLPDLTLPPINDSERQSLTEYRPYYEIGYRRFRHPKFAAVCDPRDSVEALFWGLDTLPQEVRDLDLQSGNEEASGLAILRDKANTRAVYLDYGSGLSHSHPARLSVMAYGQGDLRLLDPGPIAYGHALYKRWYATTLAHNTVVVNQKSQRTTAGNLIYFKADAWGGQAAGRCDTAYPGVRLERWVILHENVVLDVFRCNAKKNSTFDYPLHFVGDFTNLPDAKRFGPLGVEDGYDQLNDVLSFAEPPARFTVRTGPLSHLDVQVLSSGHDTFLAQGFGATPRDTAPILILRTQGEQAIFATATHFLDDKQEPVPVSWVGEGTLVVDGRRIALEQWSSDTAAVATAVQ